MLLLPLLLALAPQAADAAAAADGTVAAACARFAAYDQDGDGQVEIAELRPLAAAGEHGPRVLVLIEERLAHAEEGALDLLPRVERLVGDLAREGLRADAVAVRLAPSAVHQDGRYLLALREFLRTVAAEDALAGVLLVGRFPDALLVRTVNWRKQGDFVLRKGAADAASYRGVPYLRRVPEGVADRADIVLADLDGRWEDLYVQPRTRLRTTVAAYPDGIPVRGGPCADLEQGSVVFEDFFHVCDGKLEVLEHPGAEGAPSTWSLLLDDRAAGHECSDADLERPNALARPDILVSRIDARGSALSPRADLRDADGNGLLDADGRPQALRFADAQAVPDWRRLYEPDPALERRLLAEYLDRNHAYRCGEAAIAWRPSSLACELGSGYRVMLRAADAWAAADPRCADLRGKTTLADAVDWLASPAVLRTLRAHSDAWGSVFARSDVDAWADRLGGPPWAWTRRGERLEPSLQAAAGGGKLDWYLLYTLWANGAVAPEPSFYHHTGCDSISPAHAKDRPYDHPSYGLRQGGEALLFLANGLALVGRAKVFYDEPRGFAEVLHDGGSFGAAWARYFELESQAPSWGQAGGDIGRKRAYFWSVLGDWTLKLSTAAPKN